MSKDVVNLNRVRKKKTAQADEKRAAANRVKFGRTKAEKKNSKADRDRDARRIDDRKLDE